MIYWGQQAYKNLDALMAEMKDPAVVDAMFSKFDSDKNGGEILHHVLCSSIVLGTKVTRLRCGGSRCILRARPADPTRLGRSVS